MSAITICAPWMHCYEGGDLVAEGWPLWLDADCITLQLQKDQKLELKMLTN